MEGKTVLRIALSVLGALAAVLVVTACATIIHGGNQKITISSDPAGAHVEIFDTANQVVWKSDTTPVVAELKRGAQYFQGASYRIEITMPGYQKEVVFLTSSIDAGWYIVGNFFIGGLIGWLIIDPMTGSMWTLSPNTISQPLKSGASGGSDADSPIRVVLKQSIGPTILDSLDLVPLN